MKKIRCIAMIFLAFILLSACAGKAGEGKSEMKTEKTPSEIAEAILGSQAEFPEYHTLTPEDSYFTQFLSDYYLLEEGLVEDGIICYADGAKVSEIAVLVLAEEDRADKVRTTLTEYIKNRAGAFEGYAPQQAKIAGEGIAVTHGRYAAMLICEDVEAAQTAFEGSFEERGQNQTMTVGAPKDKDTVTVSASHDAYQAKEVLKAWQTGDDTSLSDMNRQILNAAKAAIEQEINEDMSDYEKELAIHDWMTAWSSFDMNVFDRAPKTREEADNRNPYGFLINRSAMCHGYSSTFQLFMDMLDIECITVFGLPGGNGVEHSWNMVRLDGEWYCVDVAWDDPIGGSPAHTYFNVTSDQLRAGSIHRWNESSVPEADGTAYAYGKQDPVE